ncbi:hypothetical protein BASA83_004000 [Batrachochytrium salamandrivorans]|nr:hypothetical protein BASA83_004000 [Batrachochytrium salamandrivorans]
MAEAAAIPTTHNNNTNNNITTVQGLHPSPAVPLNENVSVVQAAAYMAAKRQDAILVVDNYGQLSGILTDKDLAYRVIAGGLNPKTTPIVAVMTMNPVSVDMDATASDALNKMVAGHFRHLPVVEDAEDDQDNDDSNLNNTDSGDDITTLESLRSANICDRCCLCEALEKLERAFDPTALSNSISGSPADIPLEGAPNATPSLALFTKKIQSQLACPTLASVLPVDLAASATPMLSIHCSVLDAVVKMKDTHETAVLAFEPLEGQPLVAGSQLAGIFTTKDLVLRVLAAGMDPATTAISRVMTPHPDCVGLHTSIIDALRKMYLHCYLHLPVVRDDGVVCGMTDVLSLTYSILAEIALLENPNDSRDGPLWNRFWEAASIDRPIRLAESSVRPRSPYDSSEASSNYIVAGARQSLNHIFRSRRSVVGRSIGWDDDRETIIPDDSASAIHLASSTAVNHNSPSQEFIFKFRDTRYKKTHRFNFSSCDLDGLCALIATILECNSGSRESVHPDTVHLCYLDDEGDSIHLSSSRDLEDAVIMARSLSWKRLVLVLDATEAQSDVEDQAVISGSDLPNSDLHTTATPPHDADIAVRAGGSVVQWRVLKLYMGLARVPKMHEIEAVTPLVFIAGLAVASAFLLGKAFR